MTNIKQFNLTDEAAPDSLLIYISLIDIVSHIPEKPTKETIFPLNAIEATLVIEFKDGATDTTLVLAEVRKPAQRRSVFMNRENPPSAWPDIRKLAHYWALNARLAVDGLRSNGP